MLTNDQQEQLKALARGAVATVQSPTAGGSGFFLDDTHLLTCWHVVEGGGELRVARVGEPVVRAARVLRPDPDDAADAEIRTADLALLEVDPPAPDAPQLAALLDVRPPGPSGRAFASGFPTNQVDPAIGHEELGYDVHVRTGLDGTVSQLLMEAGQKVAPGLSGAPLIALDDGVVVGVVRWSEDPLLPDSGGGAIPIATAIRLLAEVNDVAHFPPQQTKPWRDALGEATVRRLGRAPDGTYARIDIHLTGSRAQWSVCVDVGATPGSPETLDLKNLSGPEAGQAVFSWAQWQRVQAGELSVLGGVLGSALFPPLLLAELNAVRTRSNHLHVRLLLDPQTDLAQVPWEYASIPGAAKPGVTEHVGTMAGVTFSRVIVSDPDTAGGGSLRRPRATATDVQLLTVLLPASGSATAPSLITQSLKAADAFGGRRVEPANLSGYKKAMSDATYDVVHYVGYGGQSDGQQGLYFVEFVDEDGERTLVWQSLDEVMEATKASPPRLLVVQLMTSEEPMSTRWENVPLRQLAELIDSGTQAVVGTRFPVDPKVLRMFNEAFYQGLLAGHTVETAVQLARAQLKADKPGKDDTAFGAFAVYTDRAGDVRLLDPTATPPKDSGEPPAGTASMQPKGS